MRRLLSIDGHLPQKSHAHGHENDLVMSDRLDGMTRTKRSPREIIDMCLKQARSTIVESIPKGVEYSDQKTRQLVRRVSKVGIPVSMDVWRQYITRHEGGKREEVNEMIGEALSSPHRQHEQSWMIDHEAKQILITREATFAAQSRFSVVCSL
jgi:hypothetical protein